MNILLKFFSFIIALIMAVTGTPRQAMKPGIVYAGSQTDETITGAAGQSSIPGPWAEEISNNSAYAGIVAVPPVIRVANADYGLDNQAITVSDCSAIQTQLINYSARSMQNYSTSISITLPAGASAPSLTAATQGGTVFFVADNAGGNPYTWHISGGSAFAGNYVDYTFTYNLNGRQYVQKAASYVDLVELGAGWQNYVVRRNFSNVTHTRHEYTAVLAGSCSTGSGYAIYGSGGTGYYKMSTGGGSMGFVAGAGGATSGMKLWDPGDDGKDNCSVWYCGQPGKKPGTNDDNVDGGYRANLDVYYDPSVVTNISQLGIKLLYWRSTSPAQIATMYQEKMIYLLGNPLFSNGDSSNSTAQSYFFSTNALSNRTQYIDSNPGTMTFNFSGTTLPTNEQKVTFASAIYGNYEQQVYLTTWDAWLITFHVVEKSALRTLVSAEDTKFRQIHDGYTNTDGSFTAYLTQLAKSKAVLNQPNASAAQIAAAVTDLNTAIINLKYVPANYSALTALVSDIYNYSSGFRPSITKDPDYYFAGAVYYPSEYYHSTAELYAALTDIVYGLDIRYQAYINSTVTSINEIWFEIELLNANYTIVNTYLNTIEGLNDITGSPAGNYILANGNKYPQYAGEMIYWKRFTETSYAQWEDAVNGVTLGLKIPDQATVTEMSTALRDAYNGLSIKADYSAVNAAVEAAWVYEASNYSNWSSVQDALAAVVYDLDINQQSTVDGYTAAINNAIAGLIFKDADYSAVGSAIAAANALTPSNYSNWSAVQTALDAVIYGLNLTYQSTVDGYAGAINTALNHLVFCDADLTALIAAIDSAAALNTSIYTPETWAVLSIAIDAGIAIRDAVPIYNITRQAEVDAAALAINNAVPRLVYKDADYSAVGSAIAAANALTPSNYSNWAEVQSALDAVIYGLDITQQRIVDGYAGAINAALDNLVFYDADLNDLIAAIDTAALFDESLYTIETWAVLSGAVAAGIAIRDAVPAYNITRQAEVDAAALAINNAVPGLVYKDADYSMVNTAIAAANALTPSNYSNWAEVQSALDAVIYGLDITQQRIVDGYAGAINTALDNLVFCDADLNGLIAAIDSTAVLNENIYTTGTWAALAEAVAMGISIRDMIPAYNIAGQAEVDAAALAISNAIAGLVESVVALQTAPGSAAVIDIGRGFIYGLPADGSLHDLAVQGFIEITGNGHLVYTSTALGFGTGTKVELIRDADGKVLETCYIVIFGDIDGDGYTDGRDACIVSMATDGMLTQNNLGEAAYFAADANHDGFVDGLDVQLLEQAGLFLAEISQIPARYP